MKIPKGCAKEGETKVCRLQKSLYGFRQASHNWYQNFTMALLGISFRQSYVDHSLFVYKQQDKFVAALIYVEDVVIVRNNAKKIQRTKDYLDKKFSIKDRGPLKYFLGIEVARTSNGLVLSQRKYTLDILEDCRIIGCRQSAFPMEQILEIDQCNDSLGFDSSQYRRLVERLLYLQATRPDIAYSVNILSQFIFDPRQTHMDTTIRVLRYL